MTTPPGYESHPIQGTPFHVIFHPCNLSNDYHAIVCGDADVTEWINDDIERMALETVEEVWNESNHPRWLAEERQLHELDLMRGK